MSLLINICSSNPSPSQIPANINEAVGLIKKAERLLLTIRRPEVTWEQGDHFLTISKFAPVPVPCPESLIKYFLVLLAPVPCFVFRGWRLTFLAKIQNPCTPLSFRNTSTVRRGNLKYKKKSHSSLVSQLGVP